MGQIWIWTRVHRCERWGRYTSRHLMPWYSMWSFCCKQKHLLTFKSRATPTLVVRQPIHTGCIVGTSVVHAVINVFLTVDSVVAWWTFTSVAIYQVNTGSLTTTRGADTITNICEFDEWIWFHIGRAPVGRAPTRQSGGHRLKSRSSKFVFVHPKFI